MTSVIRFLYRFLIKNAVIRWMWLLALGISGLTWATQSFLWKKKEMPKKTLLRIDNHTITNFSIRQGSTDLTFSLDNDTTWLVVKNNITARVHKDTVARFLTLFNYMAGHSIKPFKNIVYKNERGEEVAITPQMEVDVTLRTTAVRSFSIYYTMQESNGALTTFVKVPKKRVLFGVNGDLPKFFTINFNSYRDSTILRYAFDDLKRVSLRNQRDTFNFIKKDSVWASADAGLTLKLPQFKKYLNAVDTVKGYTFYDVSRDFVEPKNRAHQMVLFREKDSIVVTAYRLNKGFAINSTQNEETFFKMDTTNTIFTNPQLFVKGTKTGKIVAAVKKGKK